MDGTSAERLPRWKGFAAKTGNGDVYRYDYIFVKNEIVETIVHSPAGERTFFFKNGIVAREE
jgi:hypothetical protein